MQDECPRTKPDNKSEFSDGPGPHAEALSKSIATAAIAMYGFGFLIVSLHYSRYGFIGTNPFRPRILAAGAWFFFLSAIPIFSATRFRNTTIRMSWTQLTTFSYSYYFGCILLAMFASQLFTISDTAPFPGPAPQRWWWTLSLLLFWTLLFFLMESKKFPPIISAVASLLLVLFYAQYPARDLFIAHRFDQSAVSLWFFAIGALTVVEVKVRLRGGDWEKTAFVVLGTLFIFAWYYYPHIKASWGGGTPVNVTIFFTKESVISPGQAISAQLVDESDEGFYIVGPKENNALFVPRNAIALVYFADRVADSVLLRDVKQNPAQKTP